MLPTGEVFTIDALPPRASIEGQVSIGREGEIHVRFRATKLRRFWFDKKSDWSGWFEYNDEPIQLTWKAFWIK